MPKNLGPNVVAYLDPTSRSFETTSFMSGRAVLGEELNLLQDALQQAGKQRRTGIPSGWLSSDVLASSTSELFVPNATANTLGLTSLAALVNDWQVPVMYAGTSSVANVVTLSAPPSAVGSRRTDLVILEVWRRLLGPSPSTDGKSPSGRIWRNGNVNIATADDATLNLTDDILGVNMADGSSNRVQIQYRLRVISGVDLATYAMGMNDPVVVAHSVPASALAPNGVATTFTFTNQSGAADPGLWRAGDGNPANALGTVDGYVYALPLCAVFRRNSAPFNRDSNQNGGGLSPAASGRPDGRFSNIIVESDILDLRQTISQSGWDLQELLTKNFNYLLDNVLTTEHGVTPLGGGVAGHTVLWADEIGSTDNPGPNLIRNFDAICRRFSDRPVVEEVVLRYTIADQLPADVTQWNPSGHVVINPTSLPIYPYANVNLGAVAPSNTSFLDVTKIAFVWNGSATVTDSDTALYGFSDLGGVTLPVVACSNRVSNFGAVPLAVAEVRNGVEGFEGYYGHLGPNMDMYIHVLVSYPSGQGLTKTPTGSFGAASIVNEVPANLPATTPYNYSALETSSFDAAHRELNLTYRTNSRTFDQRVTGVSGTSFILYCPERIANVPTITNVATGATYVGVVTVSEDGHTVALTNLSTSWSNSTALVGNAQLRLTYQAVRAIPSNGLQFTLWYETRTPQTLKDSLLGSTLQVIPRYVSPSLYCLVSGSGSMDESYPFPQQYVQMPGVWPSSAGSFSGDHTLDGAGGISVSNFSANTGFIQLPTLIPAVPLPQALTLSRDPGDVDIEGRAFFKGVVGSYLPSAFSQPLSDPKKHRNCLPMICELAADGAIGPKGTLVLVVLSRWAESDEKNYVGFDSSQATNTTSASVYRLKGNPLANRRV